MAAGRSVESITLDEVLLVPVMLALTPAQLMATCFVASLAGSVVVRRPLVKAAFNAGQFLNALGMGYVVYRLVAGGMSDVLTLRTVVAAIAGTVIVPAISRLLVTSMIALNSGQPWRAMIRTPWPHVAA